MCFLNPKYKRTFKLEVCTSHGTEDEFKANLDKELARLLELEMELNKSGVLRWCLSSVPNELE